MVPNVLITGGSSGIGRACVQRFAQAGAKVCFTYHGGQERAKALVDEIGGDACTPLPLDLGDHASVVALADSLPWPVDVLVNNAGLGSQTVEAYASEEHAQDEALLKVNALGPLWLTKQLIDGMLDRGKGAIINISSVGGGITEFPGFRLADTMSKAAVASMTRALAARLAHDPVDVFAICPGATETHMLEASTLDALDDDQRATLLESLPRGRLIQPEEIAELAHFLTTEPAAVLHGAVIDASMGLGVHPGLITGGP